MRFECRANSSQHLLLPTRHNAMNHNGMLLPMRPVLAYCDTVTLGRLEACGRVVQEAVEKLVGEVLSGVEVQALRSGSGLKVLSAYHEPKLLEFSVPKEPGQSRYVRVQHPSR